MGPKWTTAAVDTIHSKGNKVVMGVTIKAIGSSKPNDRAREKL